MEMQTGICMTTVASSYQL